MITLEATKTIGGVAGTATAITYTVLGDELDTGTGVDTFKVLAQGQLPTSAANLATAVGASKAWLIKTIHLANTTASPVTGVKVFVGGLVAANQVVTFTIPANGEAIYGGDCWRVYDGTGALLTTSGGVPTTRVLTAGAGLSGGGDLSADRTFDVNVDASTIEISADTLRVKDAGITYAKIQNVTNQRLLGNVSGGAASPSEVTPAALTANFVQVDNSSIEVNGSFALQVKPLGIGTTQLANVITAGGPTGSGVAVPVLTWDAKGRLTAVTTAATVGTVAATDASVTIGGTATAPTFATGRADQIFTLHPPTSAVNFNGQIASGAANAVASTDLVTLGQLTAAVEGRLNKDPVDWSTTGVVTLSGLATQGGGEWTAPLTAGQRILVKNQASSADNGIYVVAAGAWTRSADANTGAEITNASTLIRFGATLTGDTYTQSATVTTIGTDPQTWTQTGEGATYTADGTSIVLTGTQFSRAAITGDASVPAGSSVLTLANVGPGATGPIGSTSTTAVITINAKGLVTALTSATITPAAIGAQPVDVTLTNLAANNWVLNSMPVGTGADTVTQLAIGANTFPSRSSAGNVAANTISDFGLSLVDDANQATAQATLGLVIGTNIQAWDTDLDAIAGLAPSNDDIIQRKAGVWTNRSVAQYKVDLSLTGTNSGDITLTAVGAAPNANGATLVGQALTLQPASTVQPGLVTAVVYSSIINAEFDAVRDFGFVGDNRVVFDGAANTAAPTKITSATAAFVAGDVGKRITMSFAGSASGNAKYVGVITAIDSATQVAVSPNISRTTSASGLQIETDNTTAIGNMATAINALTYPGVRVVFPRSATNRYGFPIFVPVLNKPVVFEAQGRFYNDDYGDYAKGGGTALVWSGASSDGGTAFRGMFRFEPVTGGSAQHMHGVTFADIWFDARNGDQFPALYPLQMYSQEGFSIRRFGCIDALGAAVEFDITSPVGGTAATARGTMEDFGIRVLEADGAVGVPTVTTTSSAVTLSTTPQSMTVAAAINTLYSAGYAWFETENGHPVLVNFTGGGTTTTLTGCTVSAKDAALTPKTIAGCNVVFASPNNSAALKLGGDSAGNTNLAFFRMGQVNQGTNYGAAAIDLRNADSIVFHQVVINGGNNTTMSTGPTVKRKTKPGYTLAGSNVSLGLACRNVVIYDGDAGAGGVTSLATLGGGAKMLAPAGPNYILGLQFGNGQPAPTIEAGSYLDWPNPNGGAPGVGMRAISTTALVAFTAGANKVIDGTVMLLGPQAFQIGTSFHWEFMFNKSTAAGTTSHTLTIRVGAAGTTADTAVQTFTLTTTAVTDNTILEVDFVITSLTGGNANGVATIRHKAKAAATGAGFWSASTGSVLVATPTAFGAPVSGLQYISLQMIIGAASVTTSSFAKGSISRVGNQAA